MPDVLRFLLSHLGDLRLLLANFGGRFVSFLICALVATGSVWAIFLELVNVVERFVLHKLIHATESLVVLLKSIGFSLGQTQVFVLQRKKSLQVFDFFLQLLVIRLYFFVEGLLEVKVSLECRDLTVPEIDLVFRRSFCLDQDVNFVFKGLVFLQFASQLPLQVVDFLLHDFSVGIEGGP